MKTKTWPKCSSQQMVFCTQLAGWLRIECCQHHNNAIQTCSKTSVLSKKSGRTTLPKSWTGMDAPVPMRYVVQRLLTVTFLILSLTQTGIRCSDIFEDSKSLSRKTFLRFIYMLHYGDMSKTYFGHITEMEHLRVQNFRECRKIFLRLIFNIL